MTKTRARKKMKMKSAPAMEAINPTNVVKFISLTLPGMSAIWETSLHLILL